MDTKINESEVVNYLHKDLEQGGMWEPSTCVSCYHVAIIMPYRDRYAQLRMLLHFLIPVLQRQHIRFRIFVVEQVSLLLLDFSLTVKAATLIFISGCRSAISSEKEGKSGFIYNLVKNK